MPILSLISELHHYQLQAIDEVPMPALESDHAATGWGIQPTFKPPTMTAKRPVILFVGVKADPVQVIPVLDRNTFEEFIRRQLKRILMNVFVPSHAAESGQSAGIRLEQQSVD